MFLSTFKISFPHEQIQRNLLWWFFFEKTTKSTKPTTSNSFSYQEYRNIIEVEISYFFTVLLFFITYEILKSIDFFEITE